MNFLCCAKVFKFDSVPLGLFLLFICFALGDRLKENIATIYVRVLNAIPILTIKKPGLTEVNKLLLLYHITDNWLLITELKFGSKAYLLAAPLECLSLTVHRMQGCMPQSQTWW